MRRSGSRLGPRDHLVVMFQTRTPRIDLCQHPHRGGQICAAPPEQRFSLFRRLSVAADEVASAVTFCIENANASTCYRLVILLYSVMAQLRSSYSSEGIRHIRSSAAKRSSGQKAPRLFCPLPE